MEHRLAHILTMDLTILLYVGTSVNTTYYFHNMSLYEYFYFSITTITVDLMHVESRIIMSMHFQRFNSTPYRWFSFMCWPVKALYARHPLAIRLHISRQPLYMMLVWFTTYWMPMNTDVMWENNHKCTLHGMILFLIWLETALL